MLGGPKNQQQQQRPASGWSVVCQEQYLVWNRGISGDQPSISDVASVLLPATSTLTVVSLEPSGYRQLFPWPEAESSAEVKIEWSCISPPYVLVACRRIVNKEERVAVPLHALPNVHICPTTYKTGTIKYCWVSEGSSRMLWRALHIHPRANPDSRYCERSASRPGRSVPMNSPRWPINSRLTWPQSPFGHLEEQKSAWNGAEIRGTPIRWLGYYTYWAIPAVRFLV